MKTLFARAASYASLTPAERAILRLLEGLAYVALIGAATACAEYLSAHPGASSAVDWQPILRACAAGAAVAVLMALAKYFKAHGDPALGDTLGAEAAQLAQANQLDPTDAPPALPADATDAPSDAPHPGAPASEPVTVSAGALASVPGGAADSPAPPADPAAGA